MKNVTSSYLSTLNQFKTMKKSIFALAFLLISVFSVQVQAQDLSKKMIGKWSLVDVKLIDPQGKYVKLTPEIMEFKKMAMSKPSKMEFKSDGTYIQIEDGVVDPISKNATWKVVGNEVTIQRGNDSEPEKGTVRIVKGDMELIVLGALVMVFKKQ